MIDLNWMSDLDLPVAQLHRPDHAIVMSRFARDILLKSKSLCQRLEGQLLRVLVPKVAALISSNLLKSSPF